MRECQRDDWMVSPFKTVILNVYQGCGPGRGFPGIKFKRGRYGQDEKSETLL